MPLPRMRDQEQERMYLQLQRGGRRYQNEWEEEEEEEEEEDEEEEEEDEEEAVQDGGDRALAGLELSPACGAMLKQALVAQVSGQLERAVHLYLMCFKMHPASASAFRDEFVQVLKLHSSSLLAGRDDAGEQNAAKSLTLHRLAASVLPGDSEVLTLLGRVLFVAGKEGEARTQWQAAVYKFS
jgi:hypothetical protein